MPFDVVLPLLGGCFLAAWAFIGGLLIRDTWEDVKQVRLDTRGDAPPPPLGRQRVAHGHTH